MYWIRKLASMFVKSFFYLFVTGVCLGVGLGCYVLWQVFYGDFSSLKKSTILAKIKEETMIFYLDEETPIGSIFESRHRRYIPIDEVPAHMLNALVAAEDKNFYNHFGIDPISIFKAAADNVLHRGKFRGGSTITQQTVKNIVNDWETSFQRKYREMVHSLQLERIYSKKEILEFYLNQFHVAGNGNGIHIAAKYYFNKEVKDLNLVEAAFIAGSVKGPGKYNPFIKYTKKARERATNFANERKNYVLERMFEQKWISKEDYAEGLSTDVPFNRGEFRNAEVSLVDLIKQQLNKPEVLAALGVKEEKDLNIAGLKVFTTIDSELQKGAQLAMRTNLSRLETSLHGFKKESEENYRAKRSLVEDEFVYGKVIKVEGDKPENYEIKVSFGLPIGTVPNDALLRFAKLLNLSSGKGEKYHIMELARTLKEGDVLFTQVVEYNAEHHEAKLELHRHPDISGGLIAVDKGEVRAVVSGFDTLGFNRAMFAKRQPGSVFKSLVYFSSLQLGWSVLDRIENSRQLFYYQGDFYYPRPDHISPYNSTSMVWAGVMSENLASVTLAAQLIDKLNLAQFKKLLKSLDLAPNPNESPSDYHFRVSRKTGISLNTEGLQAHLLNEAINDLSLDLIFTEEKELHENLKSLWMGTGYATELKRLQRLSSRELPTGEITLRIKLVENNLKRLERLKGQMENDWNTVSKAVAEHGVEVSFSNKSLYPILNRFRVSQDHKGQPTLNYYYYFEDELISAGSIAENPDEPFHGKTLPSPHGRSLNILDLQAVWGVGTYMDVAKAEGITKEHVHLGGSITLQLLKRINESIATKLTTILSDNDPYLLTRYFQHKDFRIAIGLYYTVKLAQECGVYNPIDPVLSFPLGTNDVSVGEIAKIYQTILSGKTYRFFESGPKNQLNFIRRIEDRFGNILYEPKAVVHQLVSLDIAKQTSEILRKAVTHGTGRRARGELYVTLNDKDQTKIRVPSFGKTGTTNDYTTSYYAGFLPYPTGDKPSNALDPQNSYVIAAYVGYDDNKPMRNGRLRIYGAQGALPLWTDFSKKVIELKEYVKKIDAYDLRILAKKEWPLVNDKTQVPYMIDLPRGLILRTGQTADGESWQTTDLAVTGENFDNPYAIDNSVQSLVYLPRAASSTNLDVARMFELYQPLNLTAPSSSAKQEAVKASAEDDNPDAM